MSQGLERPTLAHPFKINPLGNALGAEVLGLDLAQPAGPELIRQMKEALNRYGVLCFREQDLTEDQQIAFSRLWGPLEDFPEENKTVAAATVYHVANVSTQGAVGLRVAQPNLPVDFVVIPERVASRTDILSFPRSPQVGLNEMMPNA